MSEPALPGLVDLHEFFIVPGTPASVIDWVEHHRPAGFAQGDSGTTGGVAQPATPMGGQPPMIAHRTHRPADPRAGRHPTCCASSPVGRWTTFEFKAARRDQGTRELVIAAVQLRAGQVGVRVDAQLTAPPKLPGTGRGRGDVRIVASGIGSQTFTLRCDPAGGTAPAPARICAAIRADPALLYSLPGPDHSCPAGPATISITGTWNHKPLHSTFSPCTGGQEPQAAHWAQLLQLKTR